MFVLVLWPRGALVPLLTLVLPKSAQRSYPNRSRIQTAQASGGGEQAMGGRPRIRRRAGNSLNSWQLERRFKARYSQT